MKVMGEIVGAAEMDPADLEIRIEAFIARGADIIDLGATLNTLPGQVQENSIPCKNPHMHPDKYRYA